MSKPALTIQDLCKRFHTTEVLSHLNLTVAAGEVVVLVGPNGSGKSTFLGSIG
ncbi:MAG: ATP-binding cassette domain-containing protein, partial [Nannocystaceae bacterium]